MSLRARLERVRHSGRRLRPVAQVEEGAPERAAAGARATAGARAAATAAATGAAAGAAMSGATGAAMSGATGPAAGAAMGAVGAALPAVGSKLTKPSVAVVRGAAATRRADMRGTDVRGMDMRGTDVRGADVGRAELPREDPHAALKDKIHERLVKEIDNELLAAATAASERERLAAEVEAVAARVIDEEPLPLMRSERAQVISEVLDDVLGLGPITALLEDDTVNEIMVNGPSRVYVERGGRIELAKVRFRNDDHVMHIIERIVSPIGRRIDEASPMVDARLPDGSRVNAVIPPISLVGPCITIRKFARDPFTIDDLIKFGTLTPAMAEFLEGCVKARLNIVVSGGTGSGKTTTLNVLSSFIPDDERIVTIEDAAELQLRQEHVVTLEARPANLEGRGAVTIRDLVRNALRMRPDRIVVGEVRSGEALDMLQAMNTGHDGSLTTGHANSPRDMLSRLETMVLMAGMDLPLRAIREQVASAIDLIVHQARLRDGSRKITHLTEVQGMEGDVITTQDVYVFEQTGVDERGRILGRFVATGIRPKFLDRFEAAGISVPPGMFVDFL